MLNDSQIQGQNDDFGPKQPSNKPLEKNQKIAVVTLAVFGILIVVFWFAQLRKNIYGPFAMDNSSSANQELTGDQALAREQALKNKDTDSDGLNDWDEANLHNTSPYLEDSDSDGLKDGEEIKSGTDPNCPQGRICSSGLIDSGTGQASTTNPTSPASGINNLQNQTGTLNNLLNQKNNGVNGLSAEEIQALKNIDAVTLRELLVQSGMDKAVLDRISDAELMQSYSEVSQ